MSRDIGDNRWTGSDVILSLGTPAGVSSSVAPVAAVGLDQVTRDLTGPEVDDGDLALVDDGQDATTSMGGADLEMVHPAGAAQRDGALLVGHVVAQAEVARGATPGGVGLGRRAIGLGRCPSPDGAVRSLLVVGRPEGIELGLQLGQCACCRLLLEPALEGLLEALDLALRLGMVRGAVPLLDAEIGEQVLEGVAPAGEARGVDRAVVGERGRGPAILLARRTEGGHHVVAVDATEGGALEQVAGVVVEPGADLDLAAVREAPVGHVRLPDRVGRVGLEAMPGAARALARLGHDEPRTLATLEHSRFTDRAGRIGAPKLASILPGIDLVIGW